MNINRRVWHRRVLFYLIPFLLMVPVSGKAYSVPDTLNFDSLKAAPKSKFLQKVLTYTINSITKDANPDGVVSGKSEAPYQKHKGKIIRRIIIKQLGFENRVTDTTSQLLAAGSRLLNVLHPNSKDWVIRDNMFVKEGDTVAAFRIADNERYLRTLSFIQDARINIKPVKGSKDSVDLEVIIRDILSLKGGIDAKGIDRVRVDFGDINFRGLGQSILFTALRDEARTPMTGGSVLYSKNSVAGSFIDASVGYTSINPSPATGREEETTVFLQLDRPLISPYSKFAGGVYLGYGYSMNRYPDRPDSEYYNYRNNVFDAWTAYNIASRNLLKSEVRDRRIFALRYAQNHFIETPYQVGEKIDLFFNNSQLSLASFTFFRQDFYKTNYVYGFGITEDIPYGYNLSFTGGWHRQLYLNRPYLSIIADRHVISPKGDFYRYILKTGAFYHNGGLQDAGVLAGASVFSRLIYWKSKKIRQYVRGSYTRLFNTVTNAPLFINNYFGLDYFESQALAGYQRLNISTETSMFLNYRFLGFRFAPFVALNMVILTPDGYHFLKSDVYNGIGGGIRSRNENLIFNTLELRVAYFPRAIDGVPNFRVLFSSNIRYRYNSNYITKPGIVNWNTEL